MAYSPTGRHQRIVQEDCLRWMRSQPDRSVDLVFGSPPYAEKGARYGTTGRHWRTDAWIAWMEDVTVQAVRVSNGYVLWVANGAVRQGRYLPACEGLVWRMYTRGIVCERPCIWHKNSPPNRRDWFGNDWEYVLAFKPPALIPYFDWKAVAAPPKYRSGGRFRQRDGNGNRRVGGQYPTNKLARPRDVIRITVGGGHMGSPLAHENEAPFPEALAEHFIKTCCPPGGIVLDPFVGSGTTLAVCLRLGRRAVGIDIRPSQVALSCRRLREAAGHARRSNQTGSYP